MQNNGPHPDAMMHRILERKMAGATRSLAFVDVDVYCYTLWSVGTLDGISPAIANVCHHQNTQGHKNPSPPTNSERSPEYIP